MSNSILSEKAEETFENEEKPVKVVRDIDDAEFEELYLKIFGDMLE